jgi:hypothetical protein
MKVYLKINVGGMELKIHAFYFLAGCEHSAPFCSYLKEFLLSMSQSQWDAEKKTLFQPGIKQSLAF